MRDLSASDKQEVVRLTRQVEKHSMEVGSLTKDKERLVHNVTQLHEQMLELQEQVGHTGQQPSVLPLWSQGIL